jgi:hypothetical protein
MLRRTPGASCSGSSRTTPGNLPPLPGIFPDYMAPPIRRGKDGERELVVARWGMPTPPQFLGGPIDRGAT